MWKLSQERQEKCSLYLFAISSASPRDRFARNVAEQPPECWNAGGSSEIEPGAFQLGTAGFGGGRAGASFTGFSTTGTARYARRRSAGATLTGVPQLDSVLLILG